jgi:hypothetical protein
MKPWTDADLDAEWKHLYETRIAILCGERDPTPAQIQIARLEADEAIREFKK